MLKKIIFSLFILSSLIQAEDFEQTIEDKYAACEKAYDECITLCEESNSNIDECTAACDEKLYNCNSKVEEEAQTPVE
ncbi:hypothetical protein [Halarcobacter anaerophilus]|uniref:Uncharacterized protein n=1 Tax=Halarcobacter anaerophilus TaxID=877500 RepID=A0A4Q0XYC4_9BACT|nr:hypothetical protein [Halarcobacter anaerophilus]QDF29770.1 hypothetical protein AANAER_2311 [Halarcobacter anaerophilus]RXJ62690.1 hypothetical protein CRV06_09495 [Halarcobacter anaerophilus]